MQVVGTKIPPEAFGIRAYLVHGEKLFPEFFTTAPSLKNASRGAQKKNAVRASRKHLAVFDWPSMANKFIVICKLLGQKAPKACKY